VKDVTEMKRRQKFQREILSTTSHDLKGPLGTISLSSELITDLAPKHEKIYEIALRIGSSAQGAINLINEFLSARRIEEGTFILKPARLSIEKLIYELTENYRTIAEARRIKLEVDVEEGEACIDRLGAERVIGNLLSNAFKFTSKGGVVSLSARIVGSAFCLEVSDTGSGMEASEVQKIFEQFSRLERHVEVAGSGLGLFVVKSIVEAHGGSIEVTSQIGTGTTFRISFPLEPPINEYGELISLDFA